MISRDRGRDNAWAGESSHNTKVGKYFVQNFGCRATQADGAAIDQELASLAKVLKPTNVRDYLIGLPDDIDVVRIERPAANQRRATQKYLAVV